MYLNVYQTHGEVWDIKEFHTANNNLIFLHINSAHVSFKFQSYFTKTGNPHA